MEPSRPGPHVLGDLRAGAHLRLARHGGDVRREDGVVEGMQRAVRAGLLLVDVDADGGDLAGGHEVGEGVDVVDAAARGVHQDDAVFHEGEFLRTEHADGVGGLREMHRDEVGLLDGVFHRVAERHAELVGALGAAVRVVADEVHAEGARPLGDQAADAPEPEDRKRLVVELDAGELAAHPFPGVHGVVCLRDLARAGEQERHGLLGSRHDVGRGRVAHDNARLGRRLDVDVVDGHARAADDLEVARRLDDVPVDLGGRAHDQRIVRRYGFDELFGSQIELHVDKISALAEALQALVGDLLGYQDLLLSLLGHGSVPSSHAAGRAQRPVPRKKARVAAPLGRS